MNAAAIKHMLIKCIQRQEFTWYSQVDLPLLGEREKIYSVPSWTLNFSKSLPHVQVTLRTKQQVQVPQGV